MARSRPRYTLPPNYPSPAPIPETYNDRMQGIRFEDAPLNPYTYGTGFGQGGYVNLDELYDRSISPPGAYGQGGESLPEYGANTVAAGLGGAAAGGLTNFGTAESGSVGQPIPVTPNDPMMGVPIQDPGESMQSGGDGAPTGGEVSNPFFRGRGLDLLIGAGAGGAAATFGNAESGNAGTPAPQATPPAAAGSPPAGWAGYGPEDMGGSIRAGVIGANGKPGIFDPSVQNPILEGEGKYRPEYIDLDIKDTNQYAQGNINLTEDLAGRYGEIGSNANTAQRNADLADVEALGGRASAAYRNANPELAKSLDSASSYGGPSNYYADTENAVKNTPQYGDVGYTKVGYNNVGAGRLGNDIQSEAMAARGFGATGSQLDAQAQKFAQSTGELSADEMRALQQSVREGYASRGTAMGAGAVTAEALARLTNQRGRMMEDINMASNLRTANQGELESNRNFRTGVQRDDVARRQDNSLRNLDADFANQKYDASTQIENRNFQADQYQKYLDNLAGVGDKRRTQNQDDRGYALDLAGLQRDNAINPFDVIQNNRSNAVTSADAATQWANGLKTGPQLYDPSGPIDVAMTDNRNQMEYIANQQSAQAAIEAAKQQASASKNAGLLDGLISIGGAAIDLWDNKNVKPNPKTPICWVAREVYGVEDGKWLQFREWLLSKAPRWFYNLYLNKGESFAKFISNKPCLKKAIRFWMDGRIATMREISTRTAEAIS